MQPNSDKTQPINLVKKLCLKLLGSKQLSISWFGGVQIISQDD